MCGDCGPSWCPGNWAGNGPAGNGPGDSAQAICTDKLSATVWTKATRTGAAIATRVSSLLADRRSQVFEIIEAHLRHALRRGTVPARSAAGNGPGDSAQAICTDKLSATVWTKATRTGAAIATRVSSFWPIGARKCLRSLKRISGTLCDSSRGVPNPRLIPPEKTTFAVCRRINDRRFLLRPDEKLTALFTWLLAACAPLFGLEVHAVTVMSSHYHMVVSCSDQRISEFYGYFNANLGKAINNLRRIGRGTVWEPGKLNIVELKTVDAVVHAIAYAIVNPVAAGIVWSPEDWPGVSVQVDELGRRVLQGRRPDFYFSSTWDKRASLGVTLPACLLELGEEEARRHIAERVGHLLGQARAEIKKKRYRVLGPVAARTVSPMRRATSCETFGELQPTFATGPGNVAERIEAALRVIEFRAAYRRAWTRYKAGERDVVFPYGTYLMRVRHGVKVAPRPT